MLAAPIINGTLPAFYLENGIAKITIPFSMNRSVSVNDISGFSLKLKNVQGSSYLLTKQTTKFDDVNQVVSFEFNKEELDNNLFIGLFYKAQLAYIDRNNIVGYYSTVGILKYTTKPDVFIEGMRTSLNNGHIYDYTGVYSQFGRDASEKAYSYRFLVSDIDNNIIEDSGWLIHNNSKDMNHYESTDKFSFNNDMIEGEKYKISYSVRTNNNLEISSPDYKIIAKKTVQSNLNKTKINVDLNYDNAYINITFEGEKDNYGYEIPVSGYYVLSRASEDTNYTQWDEINRFTLAGQRPSKKSFQDFTIEQGKNYKYSIQQYNNKGLFSERVYSNVIHSDFEDIFLFDGTKQLKIKYNPKVSSFKIDRLEAKQDTLGSKYPFIFRNGNVEYKEFPISGLISYHSDEEGLFLFKDYNLFKKEERKLKNNYRSFNIGTYTQYKEDYKTCYVRYNNDYYIVEEGYELIKKNSQYQDSKYDIYWAGHWEPVDSEKVYLFFDRKIEFGNRGFYHQLKYVSNYPDFNTYKIAHTNLTSDNLYLEREFKLEALNWLSNGKPKLFKSPAEGNYLIRLMNISLNPNDTVGRMLHSFNATAYEIAENNYEALLESGIINLNNNINSFTKYMSIPLMSNDDNYTKLHSDIYKVITPNSNIKYATGEIVPKGATLNSFTIEDITPGTKIIIDGQEIIIGATGTYSSQIPVSSVIIPMKQIEINNEDEFNSQALYDENGNLITDKYSEENKIYYAPQQVSGYFNVVYESEITNSFNNVLTTNTYDIYSHQFIGEHQNIIEEIEDIATNILGFYTIKAYLRPLVDVQIVETYEKVPNEEINEYNFNNYYINNYVSGNVYKPMAFCGGSNGYTIDDWFNFGLNSWTYYKKIISYQTLTGTTILKYDNYHESGSRLVDKENLDLLSGYQYQVEPITDNFGLPMMKLVKFRNISNGDKRNYLDVQKKYENLDDRDLSERSASNEMLMDIVRDYPLLVKAGKLYWFDDTAEPAYTRSLNRVLAEDKFDITKKYCMPVKYTEIITAENIDSENGVIVKKYIPKSDYDDFIEFFKAYNPDLIESIYCWDDKVYINSIRFDISDSKHLNTGNIDTIKLLSSTSGTYFELYYQKQEIDYDVSKNYEIQTLKDKLNDFKYKLSREYMEELCKTEKGKNDYIKQKDLIIYGDAENKSYDEVYASYINLLERYLNEINKGV